MRRRIDLKWLFKSSPSKSKSFEPPKQNVSNQNFLNSLLTEQNLKLFTDHIDQIEKTYTIDAFKFFIDEKNYKFDHKGISGGRLFYNIDGIERIEGQVQALDTIKMNLSTLINLSEKIEIPPFEVIGEKVLEALRKNENYQRQLENFSNNNDMRDKLECFIAGQVAYRFYEAIIQKEQPVKDAYEKLTNQISDISKNLRRNENNLQNIDQKLSDLKKTEKTLKALEKKFNKMKQAHLKKEQAKLKIEIKNDNKQKEKLDSSKKKMLNEYAKEKSKTNQKLTSARLQAKEFRPSKEHEIKYHQQKKLN